MSLKNSAAVYLASYSFFFIGAVITCIIILNNKNDQLIIASALYVTSGVLFSSAVKLHSEERDRAFRFFIENQKNSELLEALSFLATVASKNDFPLTREVAEKVYLSKDAGDIIFRTKLVIVMNFFEEMALAVRSRQANEDILKSFYREVVCSTVEDLHSFLNVIRNEAADKRHPFGAKRRLESLVHLQWLYERWTYSL